LYEAGRPRQEHREVVDQVAAMLILQSFLEQGTGDRDQGSEKQGSGVRDQGPERDDENTAAGA
jgi:hypothetical protein